SETLLPVCFSAFRPPDDSRVALLSVSAASAYPAFASVTTLLVLNWETGVVSLSRLLGRIAGILHCARGTEQTQRWFRHPAVQPISPLCGMRSIWHRGSDLVPESRRPVAQRLSVTRRDRILRTLRALCAGNP